MTICYMGEERKNETVIIMASKIMGDDNLGKVTVASLIINHPITPFERQGG